MASIDKYKKSAVGRLLLHNNRSQGDGIQHSNEAIDDSRTNLNYHFGVIGSAEKLNDRINEIFSVNRKDETVLAEVIVTLPKNVPPEDERKFFRGVYDFYCQDFGEENIINAVVHKDEGTPHIHIDFVPVVKGNYSYDISSPYYNKLEEWKAEHDNELERLCAKELLNRNYFDTMHPRLSQYMERCLGYEAEILNGATENGNMSIVKIKLAAMQRKVEELLEAKEFLEQEIAKTYQLSQAHGITPEQMKYLPLIEQIDFLFQREEIYKSILKRNGYTYTKEDIEKLKTLKASAGTSSAMSILDGSYSDKDVELSPNNLYVIEFEFDSTGNAIGETPQSNFIKSRTVTFDMSPTFRKIDKKAEVNIAETKRASYCFVHSPAEGNVSAVLVELEQKIKTYVKQKKEKGERAKVIMDRLQNDKYNAGLIMMEALHIQAEYYSGAHSEKYRDEDAKEQDMEKQH